MSIVISEVYDAFIAAETPEDKARTGLKLSLSTRTDSPRSKTSQQFQMDGRFRYRLVVRRRAAEAFLG